MTNGPAMHRTNAPAPLRFGLVSTYPPKLCGLATFAAALEKGLVRSGHRVDVVRIDDGSEATVIGRPVAGELVNGVPASVRRAAVVLSRADVVIVQHEYGIYGGADGAEVIDLLDELRRPAIVVLHTVPLDPTPHQRELLIQIGERAERLVVMAEAARDRLLTRYPVDATKVVMIPHGAATPTDRSFDPFRPHDGPTARHGDLLGERPPQLLTWGLLGPGKGIEHVIDALVPLRDLAPRYTVAGVTHPKVFARDGHGYRQSLIERAEAAGVGASVAFDDTYRDVAQLTSFVASAQLVVLPYDSRDQVTSGVLVDALAAGRPVIATAFPHAVELLASGAGLVVPHGDPIAMAQAIRAALTDPELLDSMAAEARRLAPSLGWSAVARRYAQLADELTRDREAMAM
jgi:glycosyltransferase involved in cell wall biosynthesis